MSPQKRGAVPHEHQVAIQAAQDAYEQADAARRAAVVAALFAGGSVREVAAVSGYSTSTVARWGELGGWPPAEYKAAREADRQRNAEWKAFIAKFPDGPPAG